MYLVRWWRRFGKIKIQVAAWTWASCCAQILMWRCSLTVDSPPSVLAARVLWSWRIQIRSGEVKTAPVTLQEKINPLWSGGFSLFVTGFTCWNEKKKKQTLRLELKSLSKLSSEASLLGCLSCAMRWFLKNHLMLGSSTTTLNLALPFHSYKCIDSNLNYLLTCVWLRRSQKNSLFYCESSSKMKWNWEDHFLRDISFQPCF